MKNMPKYTFTNYFCPLRLMTFYASPDTFLKASLITMDAVGTYKKKFVTGQLFRKLEVSSNSYFCKTCVYTSDPVKNTS
jgi:hypothetical protein